MTTSSTRGLGSGLSRALVLAVLFWAARPTIANAESSALSVLAFQNGVDPAPPTVDTSRPPLGQLIEDTWALYRTRKRLNRSDLVDRSNVIANRVNHLIGKVESIQASWVDGGIMPPHPLLLEAVNALYASVRALRIALPEEALPEMKKAAKAIRRFRSGAGPDTGSRVTPAALEPATPDSSKPTKKKRSKKASKGETPLLIKPTALEERRS